MIRSRLLSIAIAALAVTLAASAQASPPNAANSTLDTCLRVCPAGDMTFHVLVRDAAFNPVASSTVVINLCNCPQVILCPPGPNDGYQISGGCNVVKVSDGAGLADFQIRAGGTSSGLVTVFADGVLLRQFHAVSSPDQNGDASVTAADQAILAAKMGGPYDKTGDFNCSDGLDPGDQSILDSHLGHSCAAVVPTRPGTWGRIKTIYR